MLTSGLLPDQAPRPHLPRSARVTCFSIIAQADPSVLPRILDMVAMFDLVPERCHVARSDAEPGRPLLIDLQIADLAERDCHLLQKKLERMLLTTQILCSEKRLAAA
ncbi:MAG: hypothetical protein R3F54_11860 [Alphaproteobacteria bacterium]